MTEPNLLTMPVHPAAELFPMMSETEFQAMKEDIRIHGQNDDVLIWNGTLLDGRNRLRACVELEIVPGWSELPSTIDPVSWVLSHNLHRRHLTTAQRAMVATNLATLLAGRPEKLNAQICASTQDDAAAKLKVSRRSVQQARKVRETASKKVIAAVESGEMSLNAAIETVKPSDAAKEARAKAKAEKDKAKADAAAEREAIKAAKSAEKAAAEKAKAEAKAAKEAAKAAALTTEGQAKNIANLIQQHIDKAVRLVDDLAHLRPVSHAKKMAVIKTLQGVKLW